VLNSILSIYFVGFLYIKIRSSIQDQSSIIDSEKIGKEFLKKIKNVEGSYGIGVIYNLNENYYFNYFFFALFH
jgi:hypothetical protein